MFGRHANGFGSQEMDYPSEELLVADGLGTLLGRLHQPIGDTAPGDNGSVDAPIPRPSPLVQILLLFSQALPSQTGYQCHGWRGFAQLAS